MTTVLISKNLLFPFRAFFLITLPNEYILNFFKKAISFFSLLHIIPIYLKASNLLFWMGIIGLFFSIEMLNTTVALVVLISLITYFYAILISSKIPT